MANLSMHSSLDSCSVQQQSQQRNQFQLHHRASSCILVLFITLTQCATIHAQSSAHAPAYTSVSTLSNPRLRTAIEDPFRKEIILADQAELQIVPAASIDPNAPNTTTKANDPTPETRGEITLWNPSKPSLRVPIPFPQITSLTLSPNGERLLVAGGFPGERGCVACYDWNARTLIGVYDTDAQGQQISDIITDAQWSQDGKAWIESHWSGKAVIRNIDGKSICEFTGHTGPVLTAIFWSSEIAISAGVDQSIKVWWTSERLAEGTERLIRSLDNHTAPVNELLRYQPEGVAPKLISSSQDQTVRLWDPQIGRMIRFARLKSPPGAIALTPGKNSLLVATEAGEASQWGLPLFEQQGTWKLGGRYPRSILFDPLTEQPRVLSAIPNGTDASTNPHISPPRPLP